MKPMTRSSIIRTSCIMTTKNNPVYQIKKGYAHVCACNDLGEMIPDNDRNMSIRYRETLAFLFRHVL